MQNLAANITCFHWNNNYTLIMQPSGPSTGRQRRSRSPSTGTRKRSRGSTYGYRTRSRSPSSSNRRHLRSSSRENLRGSRECTRRLRSPSAESRGREVLEVVYVGIVLNSILNGAITCILWRWGIVILAYYKNAHELLLPTISLLTSWLCNFLSVFLSLSIHIPEGFQYPKNQPYLEVQVEAHS